MDISHTQLVGSRLFRLLTISIILLVESIAFADAQPQTYWSDNWRGWHFYEEPPVDEVTKPVAPRATAPAAAELPKDPELLAFERLQKELEARRNIAIMRPTEANVRAYMALESQVLERASYFADMAQRVAWATPELDPTLRGRPVGAKALEVFEQQQLADRSLSIATLGRDHVLFFWL